MNVPKRVEERIKKGLKKYKRILKSAKDREINESDTRVIITDMLSDIFGYDKYGGEIFTEQMKRGGVCDYLIKLDDKPHFIIEVKRVGTHLKERDVEQAVNYAVNNGIQWAILTNGIDWQAYKVMVQLKKPVDQEMVINLNLLETSPKDSAVINQLYLLCKEGAKRSAIDEFEASKQATDRFTISAILQSENMLKALRKEIKKVNNAVKIDIPTLRNILRDAVFKYDLIDEENKKVINAMKKINRLERKNTKQKEKSN